MERIEPRPCGCPCGQPLPPSARANRRYIDERHKERARRQRLLAALRAAGLPTVLTLEAARVASHAREQVNHGPRAPRRRESHPRPGLSVYLPTLAEAVSVQGHIEAYLSGIQDDVPDLQVLVDALEKAIARRRKRA